MRMTEPRRFPFVAQLGDHVVYFRQGHEMYLERVEATNLYPISSKMRPKSVDVSKAQSCDLHATQAFHNSDHPWVRKSSVLSTRWGMCASHIALQQCVFPRQIAKANVRVFRGVWSTFCFPLFEIKRGIKIPYFRFHDLANVPDFIILKQHYDLSIAQNVQEGDRIEAILDGQWWTGTVDRKEPKSEEFPRLCVVFT